MYTMNSGWTRLAAKRQHEVRRSKRKTCWASCPQPRCATTFAQLGRDVDRRNANDLCMVLGPSRQPLRLGTRGVRIHFAEKTTARSPPESAAHRAQASVPPARSVERRHLWSVQHQLSCAIGFLPRPVH